MPRKHEKRLKTWTESDLARAIAETKQGKSVNSVAIKYGMDEGTLRYCIKKENNGELITISGRKPVMGADTEQTLAKCIGTLCEIGFSPSVQELLQTVGDYIKANNIKATMFKDGRPGREWFYAFMKRNNLSMKKANMISITRKSATGNPFVVYDFYEKLEKIIMENNLQPHQIWNCDESGFPNDPGKCKVVSVKGKTAYNVTCGTRRENITTLAAVNAAGRTLDPLIEVSPSQGNDLSLPEYLFRGNDRTKLRFPGK